MFTAASLLSLLVASYGTITGRVTDAQSGQALVGIVAGAGVSTLGAGMPPEYHIKSARFGQVDVLEFFRA